MKWIKLKDRKPEIEIDGDRVLIYRTMNPSQDSQSPSIFPIKMINLFNSDETWWMSLPEKSTIN